MAAVLPGVLASLTNEERQAQKLPTLKVSAVLNKAATMKAEDMATKRYFAHTSPDGKSPWYWLKLVGYKYQYAGENLAINFNDSEDVTEAWMNSPTHKANIVKGNYTEIGTGIARGVYEGHDTVFVAQVYANPMPSKTKVQNVANKEIPKNEIAETPVNVLGEEVVVDTESVPVKETQEPTFLQKLVASPRNTTNIILYVVFAIILFTLILYIFIKMRDHHIDLITNGLMMLAVILAIFIVNSYLSNYDMVLLDSFNYSSENL